MRFLILPALLLAMACAFAPARALGEERALYVAPEGDDLFDGASPDAPLRTLSEALARLGDMTPEDSAVVWLRGGTYAFTETLYFPFIGAGEVAIRAYPGEIPVLTGSERITGWTEEFFQGRMVWRASYEGPVPRALYGEDGARPLARWPKEGMLRAAGPVLAADSKFDSQKAFYGDASQTPAWLDGAVVRLLHYWQEELSAVNQYNPATGLITLRRPMSMTVSPGDRYWFENVYNITMEPGEWAYDPTNRALYYAPREGESIEETPLFAGAVAQLLNINGVTNLSFEGITFARTGWDIPLGDLYADYYPQAAYDADAAVFISSSANIAFSGCTFRDMGAGCIRLDYYVKDASVSGCTFYNIGAHAVYVHGKNYLGDDMATERIRVEGNLIAGYGKNFRSATAILVIHARNVDIAHNEISGGTYTAISAGWVWGEGFNATESITVRNNLLYDIGQGALSDLGAVYLLGNQPGTVVTGNVIHDVVSADYGGWGIYLDEGSSGILVTDNLVYRCSAQGFHQNNGQGNTVRNNIFANNREGQVASTGPGSFVLDGNVLVGQGQALRRIAEGRIRVGQNFISEDLSVFVDPESGDYTLRDPGLAEAAGFIPWDVDAGWR